MVPDPEQARRDLRTLAEDPRAAACLADARCVAKFLRLGAVSRHGAAQALLDPEAFRRLVAANEHHFVFGRHQLARELAAALAEGADRAEGGPDMEEQRCRLARFKNRHLVRIMVGDAVEALAFPAVVGELSDLADVLVDAALGLAARRIEVRHPGLDALQRFAVLGMGKLGGRELNYSSDIDLIFVYEPPEPEIPEIDHHAAFQRLGAEVVRILDEPTAAGRIFRIDMRLRPEGDRGELALSRRETEDYYWSVGRPWERQAMLKARAIAGAIGVGERLLAELGPWIHPVDPPWEVIDEARTMRRRIEERAQSANIKTGAGGIRDIEFLAQYFQLLYAGRDPGLRSRSTIPTLRALADRGIVPRTDADELIRHYLWLRQVEHRLQIWEDRQEHEIPAAIPARRAVAARCGYAGPDGLERFDAELDRVRRRVRELCTRHFLAVPEAQDALLALIVQGEADARLAGRFLGGIGFTDVATAAANLRALAVEPFFVLSRQRTERSLVLILPLLLHLIRETPEPDRTLSNLARVVTAVGGRATFFDLLGQRPLILELFVSLCGWSNFLVELFATVPGLPDEICDTLSTRDKPVSALHYEARSLVQGLANPAPPLHFLVARETAVIAVRELEGADQEQVGRRLTTVADAVIAAALQRIIAERARAWGVPMESGRPTRFAVLGLGKLGGGELSYASDLDVIFVCDPGGHCPRQDRGGEEFWTKVAQDFMTCLQEGRVFELDPRLRPYGDQSELVATTAALARYWSEPREVWERLAMVRTRLVAGDPRLGTEAVELVRAAAIGRPLPGDAAAQVRAMRQRLEESVAGRDHLKRGRGGYVDHEFICQYLCLGRDPVSLPEGQGTIGLIRHLGTCGAISPIAAVELTTGLKRLRQIESRMRLAAGKAVSSIPTEPGPRAALARRCGYTSLAAMDEDLHLTRERAREWFDRLIV